MCIYVLLFSAILFAAGCTGPQAEIRATESQPEPSTGQVEVAYETLESAQDSGGPATTGTPKMRRGRLYGGDKDVSLVGGWEEREKILGVYFLSQNQIGACGAMAISNALTILARTQRYNGFLAPGERVDPGYIYKLHHQFENQKKEKEGKGTVAYGERGGGIKDYARIVNDYGFNVIATNSQSLDWAEENIQKEYPSQKDIDLAKANRIRFRSIQVHNLWYSLQERIPNIERISDQIDKGIPVIASIYTDDNFHAYSSPSDFPAPDKNFIPDYKIIMGKRDSDQREAAAGEEITSSGHAVVIVGYRNSGDDKQICILNSYGNRKTGNLWGWNGFAWMDYEQFRLICYRLATVEVVEPRGGAVTRYQVPNEPPTSSPQIPQRVARLYRDYGLKALEISRSGDIYLLDLEGYLRVWRIHDDQHSPTGSTADNYWMVMDDTSERVFAILNTRNGEQITGDKAIWEYLSTGKWNKVAMIYQAKTANIAAANGFVFYSKDNEKRLYKISQGKVASISTAFEIEELEGSGSYIFYRNRDNRSFSYDSASGTWGKSYAKVKYMSGCQGRYFSLDSDCSLYNNQEQKCILTEEPGYVKSVFDTFHGLYYLTRDGRLYLLQNGTHQKLSSPR